MRRNGGLLAIIVLFAVAAVVYARANHGTLVQSTQQSDETTAIQQVIQQSDAEQVQAIANQDPSSMGDTSTPQYFAHMQQTNQQLLTSGVTTITLNGIEWGPIAANGTNATAVDYETWTTVYSDASTEESRDENDYVLVQQNGRWLVASDTQPNAVNGQRGSRLPTPVPTTPTPAPNGVPTPASASRSANWAGYASTTGSYTSITGTWTIPAFTPSSPPGMDATWVGIGGVNSQDLIQAGTQEQTSGSGQTLYSAWVETLPQPSQPVSLVVRAGDSITVSVNEQTPGTWQITLNNNTTSQQVHTGGPYPSSHSSAEWIEEAPSAGRGGILPLDMFGTVKFEGASATTNGQSVPLAETGAQPIELQNASGQALAVTSQIGPDGRSFSVTRTDVPDAKPGGRSSRRGGGGR